MKIIVLGAGVIGVTSAWYLAKAGHQVIVVERRAQAALETSFANGGQISVSHAEPWANPRAPLQILQWLLREDAPLLFRLRADPAQWRWGLQFLRECLPGRTRKNTLDILALACYSRDRLHELRSETGIEYDALCKGILCVYTRHGEYRAARAKMELLRAQGCPLEEKSPAECVALEPALQWSRTPLAGGFHAPQDESGDARKFTQALAARCAARGVEFRYGTDIAALESAGGQITGVRVATPQGGTETLRGDAYLVALGSYSPLLAGLNEKLPVYPVKGYSVTLPADNLGAPTLSITDETHKIVLSRLGDRLRIAGTAEIAGYDASVNERRCQAILNRAFELFPRAGDRAQAEFWAGLRPATPGNVPVIGRGRCVNLFLNTGHGTLGWTLACGSGQAISDLISGEKPQVAFPFHGLP